MVNSFCQKSDCLIDNLAIAFLTQVTATSHSHHKANWCNLAIALSTLSGSPQPRAQQFVFLPWPPLCWIPAIPALAEHLLVLFCSCRMMKMATTLGEAGIQHTDNCKQLQASGCLAEIWKAAIWALCTLIQQPNILLLNKPYNSQLWTTKVPRLLWSMGWRSTNDT